MHLDAPYFSILLCLMPDDFAYQVESAATQWVIWSTCVQLKYQQQQQQQQQQQ
jgi:hypothetical protein